ncbi:MAG: TSUP family transporter [Bacteroidota bacterium]
MDHFSLAWWIYPVLLFVGFITGLINSIAGGGGLISVPFLIAIGMPPHFALGTNKLQASIGSFISSNYHIKREVVKLKEIKIGIIFSALGAIVGAISVQQINPKTLELIIPILLLIVLINTLHSPQSTLTNRKEKISKNIFYIIFGFAFGFYDGFFGPGVGLLWAFSFSAFLGYNLSKSTSHTSVVNFTSNLVALIIFLINGVVLFLPGIIMGVGQIIGARIGAQLVIERGAKFIRPIFIFMTSAVILKIIFKYLP